MKRVVGSGTRESGSHLFVQGTTNDEVVAASEQQDNQFGEALVTVDRKKLTALRCASNKECSMLIVCTCRSAD
jgi:hypothetical protein